MVSSVVKDAVGDSSVVGSVEPVCYKYVADYARAAVRGTDFPRGDSVKIF